MFCIVIVVAVLAFSVLVVREKKKIQRHWSNRLVLILRWNMLHSSSRFAEAVGLSETLHLYHSEWRCILDCVLFVVTPLRAACLTFLQKVFLIPFG